MVRSCATSGKKRRITAHHNSQDSTETADKAERKMCGVVPQSWQGRPAARLPLHPSRPVMLLGIEPRRIIETSAVSSRSGGGVPAPPETHPDHRVRRWTSTSVIAAGSQPRANVAHGTPTMLSRMETTKGAPFRPFGNQRARPGDCGSPPAPDQRCEQGSRSPSLAIISPARDRQARAARPKASGLDRLSSGRSSDSRSGRRNVRSPPGGIEQRNEIASRSRPHSSNCL